VLREQIPTGLNNERPLSYRSRQPIYCIADKEMRRNECGIFQGCCREGFPFRG
jgi:hypothetical protein